MSNKKSKPLKSPLTMSFFVVVVVVAKVRDVMDYFRAIVKKDEYSQRALDLVTVALEYNPANYSIW